MYRAVSGLHHASQVCKYGNSNQDEGFPERYSTQCEASPRLPGKVLEVMKAMLQASLIDL